MSTLPAGSDEALAPVRDALASAARTRVEQIARAAQADATTMLEAAAQERARIEATAEAAGTAEATSAAALISSRNRRLADEVILAQREEIRRSLSQRVRLAAEKLATDPRYPEIVQRLTTRARRILGQGAIVTEAARGGVTAVVGTRAIDLTLPTLAERELDAMRTDVEALWNA